MYLEGKGERRIIIIMAGRLKNFIIITGHYGSGKTNFSLNLALDMQSQGRKVTIVDLDLVNPYFRTSDYRKLLEDRGIEVITPVYGGTNLDIPSLPAEMYSIFEGKDVVIVDVGGDDVGSTVLGRFRHELEAVDYDMFYVVNRFRNLTVKPAEAVEILREIEQVSGLRATMLVNNSHLCGETGVENVIEGAEYAEEISRLTDLPIYCTTVSHELLDKSPADFCGIGTIYPVSIYVKANWQE